ncbi:hypothetical protein I4F81_011901 [Pyropia yezoensis]|uniref:Uncharacterized protein n=1 Tax=Pyropia yezoensis TaxID=2788 RepID=A0ACC3CH50_PYRYE|nr:hypothetical protein I4F81_011901 [Neopyropia yezoensis]
MAAVNLSRTLGDAAARLVLRAPADTLFACLCDALGVGIPPYVHTAEVAVIATPLEVTLHLDPTVCERPGVALPTAVVTQPMAAASGAAAPPGPPARVVHTVELARVDYAATAAATVAVASAAAAAASATTANAPPSGRVPVAVDAVEAAAYCHRLGGVGGGRCVCVLCGVAGGTAASARTCASVSGWRWWRMGDERETSLS